MKKINLLFCGAIFYGFFTQIHTIDDRAKCVSAKSLQNSIIGRSIFNAVKPNENVTYSLSKDEQIIECETIPAEQFSEEDYFIFHETFYKNPAHLTFSSDTVEKYKANITDKFAHAKIMTEKGWKIVGAVKYWGEEKKEKEIFVNIFIGTHPDYQKKGIGTALINHIIALTQDKCAGIQLTSQGRALEFYQKIGFTQGAPYMKQHLWGPPVETASQEFTKKYSKEEGVSNYV